MPIKGLTDREGPGRMPRLGTIRKGALEPVVVNGRPKMDRNGKPVYKPVDLPYFRFKPNPGPDSDDLVAIWKEEYGDKPQKIDVVFAQDEIEEVWASWMESYNQSHLKFRCNGEHWVQWVNDDYTYTRDYNLQQKRVCPYCSGQRPRTKEDPGDAPHGYLEVVLLPFINNARVGTLTFHTGSLNDLPKLTDELLFIYRINGDKLTGAQCWIVRKLEDVSTRYKDSNGKWHKGRDKKWMIHIVPDPEWLARKMRERSASSMALEGPVVQQAALTDSQYVDFDESPEEEPEFVEGHFEEAAPPEPEFAPEPEEAVAESVTRPFPPEVVKAKMRERIDAARKEGFEYHEDKLRHNKRFKITKNLENVVGEQGVAAFLEYILGQPDPELMDEAEIFSISEYIKIRKNEDGEWEVQGVVADEMRAVVAAAAEVPEKAPEQPTLFNPDTDAVGSFFEDWNDYGLPKKREYAERLFQKGRQLKVATLPSFTDATIDAFIKATEDALRNGGVG